MKVQPWHFQLLDRVFLAGPSANLERIGREFGKTAKQCERVVTSDWGVARLEVYHSARRQVLASKGVRPLEELQLYTHEAVRGLVAAMWLAVEKGNARELRESCVAILAHCGFAPVKKVEKKVEHLIDGIQDPVLLARIISGEVDPEELAALPPPGMKQ